MSQEMWYIAIADEGPLLRRALLETGIGDYLGGPAYFERDRARYLQQSEGDADFLELVDEMNLAHPGIEYRIYTLDCAYDILQYLLSEHRRSDDFSEPDLGTKAIRGATYLPEHLQGGQGHRICYTPPADAREIAGHLETLSIEDLRAAFSPVDMEHRGVYKFQSSWCNESTWIFEIFEYFEGLRTFYSNVALHGEGVLVVVT